MPKPMMNSCCACYSLKTGTIVSGVLGIILSIISIIVILTVRAEFKTLILDEFLSQDVIKIILIVNLCMTILISLLLVIGALKRNYILMAPWVILGIMLVIGLLISVIWTAVVFFIDDHITSGILWIVFGLLSVVIYFYMWAVCYSFFAILMDEAMRGKYSRQPYRR